MNYNFARIAAGVPSIVMGNPAENAKRILAQAKEAEKRCAQLISFPELSITGYTIGDLMQYRELLDGAYNALDWLLDESESLDIIMVVGMPVEAQGMLFNCGVAIHKGEILAVVPKRYIPNYGEFGERRWFANSREIRKTEIELACRRNVTFGEGIVIKTKEFSFGIEICEDLWAPLPPSSELALLGAEVIVNLSASDELLNKNDYLIQMVCHQTTASLSAYVYCSAGNGESSTDLVFCGKAGIAECGEIVSKSKRFSDDPQIIYGDINIDKIRAMRMKNTTFRASVGDIKVQPREVLCDNNIPEFKVERKFTKSPYFDNNVPMDKQCREMFRIQTTGLVRRMRNIGVKNLVIGISGGLDSTLALLVCAEACDRLGLPRKNIYAVTMPGYGTSDRTHNNALEIMEQLGVTSMEISITEACDLHFKQIGHDKNIHDVTYENTQARQRTLILMNLANKYNGIVVGTGDLSELVLGWATYNGDQMSMYGVNAGVPKTLVRKIVEYVAENMVGEKLRDNLLDIVDTPISPELVPMEGGQVTEDFVGPYPLHDFFMYYMLKYGFGRDKIVMMASLAFADEYDLATIEKWYDVFFHRFKHQQFKRSCLPDGPKVVSIGVSPRGDLRLPSDLK